MANSAEAAEPSELDSDVPSEAEKVKCHLFNGDLVDKDIAFFHRDQDQHGKCLTMNCDLCVP